MYTFKDTPHEVEYAYFGAVYLEVKNTYANVDIYYGSCRTGDYIDYLFGKIGFVERMQLMVF
jgi:hypothetical protein